MLNIAYNCSIVGLLLFSFTFKCSSTHNESFLHLFPFCGLIPSSLLPTSVFSASFVRLR